MVVHETSRHREAIIATELIGRCMVGAVFALVLAPSIPANADTAPEAFAAYEIGDYGAAQRLLRPIAEQGNPRAQALLGNMCRHGWGLRRTMLRLLNGFERPPIAATAWANPPRQHV